MEIELSHRLSVLGHPQRLAVFRLLMRRYPGRVPAGEVASALDIKASTLSSYLAALVQAGLVSQTREGTFLHYQADMNGIRDTFGGLFLDCCRGRPDLCWPAQTPVPDQGADALGGACNVLFVCTGNSARSIFAECILRAEGGDRFNVFSAGTSPSPDVHPIALDVLKANGHVVDHLRPRTLQAFRGPEAPRFDFVFTVCDQAANEDFPVWEGQPVSAHWGLPDPVAAQGTEAEKALAFHQVYGALRRRISGFAALPIRQLSRTSLQNAVDEIGRDF